MEIVEDEPVILLSNPETFSLVQEVDDNSNKKHRRPQNVSTIIFETVEYFKRTGVRDGQGHLKTVLEALKEYPLTRAERLQLVNLWPKSLVDIYLIVEECEERFDEAKVEELLQVFRVGDDIVVE